MSIVTNSQGGPSAGRAASKLTKTAVEAAPLPPAGKAKAFYWDRGTGAVTGFGLSVTATGERTYVAQARVNGKSRRVTIGRHGVWTVEQARKKAAELLLGMANGVDPQLEKRKAAATAVTLREVMEEYLSKHRTPHGEPLRASTQTDIRRHVEKNLVNMADKPVADITRDACLAAFNEISLRAKGQANQCMVTLRALINYAREKHATPDGEYTIHRSNPVSMAFNKHKLGKLNKVGVRKGRIPKDKIGAAWAVLQERRHVARTVDDKTAADYVSMLMLTGCRANEIATLKWENVNLDEGWFRIPKEVAKNHNELALPLSKVLRQILAERRDAPQPPEHVLRRRAHRPERERSPYVFASWGKLGHIGEARSTMDAVSEAAGVRVTRHDLRRTLEDVATLCHVSDDQRRQLLNHLASDVHGQHYANNPDPKTLAVAVQRIADWIEEQAVIASTGNVVSLPQRVSV